MPVQDYEAILGLTTRVLDTVLSGRDLKTGIKLAAEYVSSLCFQLVAVRDFEAGHWEQCIVPYVTPFVGETEAHAAAEGILARCQEADQRAAEQIAAQEDVEEGEAKPDCHSSCLARWQSQVDPHACCLMLWWQASECSYVHGTQCRQQLCLYGFVHSLHPSPATDTTLT